MLVLLGTLLALLLVVPLGGRLHNLSLLRLRQGWLVGLALLLQVLAITIVPTWPRMLLVGLHLLSYLLAAVFVWRNRALPGLWLLATGAASNGVAIALNGGTLPASESALRAAGVPIAPHRFVNSGVVHHPRLAFLGDNYASPSWLPLHNAYSVGDLLILAGAVWLLHRTCGSVLARNPVDALREYRALTSVRIEEHLDALDERDQARLERDDARDDLRELSVRHDELRRELARLHGFDAGSASLASAAPQAEPARENA